VTSGSVGVASSTPEVVDRIVVRFQNEDAGVDELAWGQWEIWSAMVRQGSWLPVGGTVALPAGTTVGDMVDELRWHLTRHQSMRTRLRFDADGSVRQAVAADGEVVLEVVDAGGADPASVAAAVEQRYRDEPFDYERDLPVRAAVICRDGVPTHLVEILCHLVTDAFGGAAMLADLSNRDPATGQATRPPSPMQPLEQVRWQRSPAGQRQNANALRYWERLLREIEPRRFRGSSDPRRPRHWEAEFDSPAMLAAVSAVARRTGADGSIVLFAAFAAAVARLTGVNPSVIQAVVNNRFWPGLADVVSPVNQTTLRVVDVGDATFDEVVGRVRRSMLSALKAGYYDPRQLDELVARVAAERGEELDLACYFNDRRVTRTSEVGEEPTAEALRAGRQRTTFRWARQRDEPFERLFLHVEPSTASVRLTLCADTHFVSPADMRACLLGMEALTIDAALDPATQVRLPA
jgi:hypothetical protein